MPCIYYSRDLKFYIEGHGKSFKDFKQGRKHIYICVLERLLQLHNESCNAVRQDWS